MGYIPDSIKVVLEKLSECEKNEIDIIESIINVNELNKE